MKKAKTKMKKIKETDKKERSNKQILDVAKVVSYEMDVPKEVIFEAIEAALEIATKRRYLSPVDVRVRINPETGEYLTFRRWTVVNPETVHEEQEFNPDWHLTLAEAKQRDPSLKEGDTIEEPMESVEFGRIAAQTAKQVIVQKVREAKRAKVLEVYADKVGQLITGIVKRVGREGITLDAGDNAEVLIPRTEMLSNESVHVSDRVRAYLYEIRPEVRGAQLFASRASKEMLYELFKIEVPEIGEDVIEVKALARDPGVRSKIAVKTNDGRIDPIGACVGMRGSRVQVISNELNGERIDIILWDDNPAQLVINAMAPAEVASIVLDEETHSMDIVVDPDQLSQAIGRGGQNVRLASELTGWTLNVMSHEDAEKKSEHESEKVRKMFMKKLDVDEAIADILVREGFTSVEEIAYVPVEEMLNIEEFDEEIVQALRGRAKEISDAEAAAAQPSEDLLTMKGMSRDLAYSLAAHGIHSMDELAELSVDDLVDKIGSLNREKAAELIMTAREPWFK